MLIILQNANVVCSTRDTIKNLSNMYSNSNITKKPCDVKLIITIII